MSAPLTDAEDLFNRVDIDDAELSWTDGSVLVSSLQPGGTVSVHITVPEAYRDTYEDTDVALSLTEPEEVFVPGEGS